MPGFEGELAGVLEGFSVLRVEVCCGHGAPKGGAMNRKSVALILAVLAMLVSGCEKKMVSPAQSALSLLKFSASAASPQRYIAESQKLEIITPESQLPKSWESAAAFCATIRCEVISSSITMQASDAPPSGDISLRVAPDDLSKLLAYVEKLGKVAQHTTEREDETISVVNTDAKIKNLTSFRDNLRAMLVRPSAKLSDLVEIQKQLTDTQSELDGETAERKILANETEKIAVQISFRVVRPGQNPSGIAEIRNALRESGSVLADSISDLITTVFTIIPWLVLIVPICWFLAKAWRKLRRQRNQTAAPSPSSTVK
ncbi:MAG: DUF4349 domain-containing protein [Candidatus Acidiferrales bacterium]